MIHIFCLAAGSGTRFGSNKLLAQLNGRPVCVWTMELLQRLAGEYDVRVVTRYSQVAELAEERGIPVVDSPLSRLGLSYTIKAAIRSLKEIPPEDYLLFLLGDQPWLTEDTLHRMIAAAGKGCLGATAVCDGVPGSPTLFRADLIPELLALEGDRGGRQVLNRYSDQIVPIRVTNYLELMDVDSPEDLARLN